MVVLPTAFAVALPLYLWPGKTAWDPVYKAITDAPTTTFDIIVNPDSGPGKGRLDPEYIAAVSRLDDLANVNPYGYVHVKYGKRNLQKVVTDIKTYAAWPTAYNISVVGIFIDEAPDDIGKLGYMKTLYDEIKSVFPTAANPVWTNPGTPVADEFYDVADTVTAIEETEHAFEVARAGIPLTRYNQTCVMINGFKGDAAAVRRRAEDLLSSGFRSGFVYRSARGYDGFDRTWAEFAAVVARIQQAG